MSLSLPFPLPLFRLRLEYPPLPRSAPAPGTEPRLVLCILLRVSNTRTHSGQRRVTTTVAVPEAELIELQKTEIGFYFLSDYLRKERVAIIARNANIRLQTYGNDDDL